VMAADLIDYLAEMALLKDIEARDARIATLESQLAASEAKCAEQQRALEWYSVGHCEKHEAEIATERAARAEAERLVERDKAILDYWLKTTGNTREGLLRIWGRWSTDLAALRQAEEKG
jgi:hypothetical protein